MPRNYFAHFGRLLLAGVLTIAAGWSLAQAAHAAPAGVEPPEVSPLIKVPSGNKVFLLRHAVGVQIYKCNPAGDNYAWSLLAPRADLYDASWRHTGTHYAGPYWEERDGSKVKGKRVNGVTEDPSAIQWLLLAQDGTFAGPDGDRLKPTTYIHRVNTVGGLADPATCNAESVGDIDEVPYTADYYFYKAK